MLDSYGDLTGAESLIYLALSPPESHVPAGYSIGALPAMPIPHLIEEARRGSTLSGIKFLFPPDGALLEVKSWIPIVRHVLAWRIVGSVGVRVR